MRLYLAMQVTTAFCFKNLRNGMKCHRQRQMHTSYNIKRCQIIRKLFQKYEKIRKFKFYQLLIVLRSFFMRVHIYHCTNTTHHFSQSGFCQQSHQIY